MFHSIPAPILETMRSLEARDAQDRQDGAPRLERLRQIPPETGRFLALLAANAPEGVWGEIGASGDTLRCGWRWPAGRAANISSPSRCCRKKCAWPKTHFAARKSTMWSR